MNFREKTKIILIFQSILKNEKFEKTEMKGTHVIYQTSLIVLLCLQQWPISAQLVTFSK